jgi:hypothetical protein
LEEVIAFTETGHIVDPRAVDAVVKAVRVPRTTANYGLGVAFDVA